MAINLSKPKMAAVAQIAPEPSKPMPHSLALLTGKAASIAPIVDRPSELEEIASRIRTRLETSAIEIGKDLLAAKELMAHGEWQPWLKANFAWSPSQAKRFMDIGKDPKSTNLAILPFVAQAALAAPSTPEAVKDEVIADLEAGKKPSLQEVQAKITAAKAEKPAKVKPDATPPQQSAPGQKPAPEPSEASSDQKAEQAKAKIVKRLRTGLKPDERLDFSVLCMTAGWTELGQLLGEDC